MVVIFLNYVIMFMILDNEDGKMKILAIDTSNQPLSVAVLDDDKLLVTKTTNLSRNHSVTLMPMIAQLLEDCHLNPVDIDRFVVAEGPGSYTGLRIGVTAAKTLASTLNKELVGVSSLQVVAANLPVQQDKLIVPYFDARNLNVFTGAYQWKNQQLVSVLADQHLSFERLLMMLNDLGQEIIFVGNEKTEFKETAKQKLTVPYTFANANYQVPQAAILGRIGRQLTPSDIDSFVPQYRRLTQAELQWMEKHPEEKNHHGNYVEKV